MTTSPGDLAATKKRANWWTVACVIILILAIATRLIGLGDRAVSHDETTHAKYSWNLYAGHGFRHDPLMHGTLLFEVTSFFYFLFGVSDFTARLYAALCGIALVMTPLLFRKWLGRTGALSMMVLLLISPSITYYSRYTRHDIPIILFFTLLLWTVLQYLDTGNKRWLYGTAVFFPLMYASKENAYMYTAVFLGLLAQPFLWHVVRVRWAQPQMARWLLLVLVAVLILGVAFALSLRQIEITPGNEADSNSIADISLPAWGSAAFGLAFLALLGTVPILYYGVGAETMRKIRIFDVLIALGTLTLPLGSALMMEFAAGVDMQAFYKAMMEVKLGTIPLGTTAAAIATLVAMVALSVGLGLWWDRKHWPILALVHYGVFFITYSTFFTYGWGVLTGMVGGLAYWIGQQGVERGSQPWYYYAIIGPLYDYLPLALAFAAGVWAIVKALFQAPARRAARERPAETDGVSSPASPQLNLDRLFPLLLTAWALLAWGAYAVAGEKMPWLFTHIAFPHIFLAAWGLGQWLKNVTWADFTRHRGWVLSIAVVLLWIALATFRQGYGELQNLPELAANADLTITQLEPFVKILSAAVGAFLFGGILVWIVDRLGPRRALRLFFATLVVVMGVVTVRTMTMLNFIYGETAKEFMVYAHATPDVKKVLARVDDVSWRTTGTPHDVNVAYGKEGAWPFLWYMETTYPNNYYYGDAPDPERLLECPIVIAGKPQWADVEEILGADYVATDYKYIWWPIEDYKDLTWARIQAAWNDPAMRNALWDIIRDRDYTAYAQLKNPDDPFTTKTWPHRLDMRLYVRRDLTQRVWDYRPGADGATQLEQPAQPQIADPFAETERALPVTSRVTLPGLTGRGIAAAPDGTLYVADTAQHRIWHITADGDILNTWGSYGTASGQFNEPWDVAVDADGSVYVADTWNHRVQKFTAEGEYLFSWGRLGQTKAFEIGGRGLMYGPRGIAVGSDGAIYVVDTGNKRVQVFDADGSYLREFGGAGVEAGEMDEPVGIAVSGVGHVYVADTWNRRVQVFAKEGIFLRQWDVPTWGTGDPEEKPYLAITGNAVFAGDPVHQRVLAFDLDGALLWALRDPSGLDFPEGLAVMGDVLYVAGAHSEHVMGFQLP